MKPLLTKDSAPLNPELNVSNDSPRATDCASQGFAMNAEVYKAMLQEIEWFLKAFRDELNQEPRILTPLKEARDAVKTKYNDVKDRIRGA